MFKKYLKNICLLLIFILFTCGSSFAVQFKFDNENYDLQFSKKAPLTGGYMNEYIRPIENTENWTRLVGIYHYPNKTDPIELTKMMGVITKQMNKKAGVAVMINQENNSGIVEFVTYPVNKDNKPPAYFEFNVFKFEKYKKNSVIAFQYARRYYFKKDDSLEGLKEEIFMQRKKFVNLVADTSIPKLIEKDVEKK